MEETTLLFRHLPSELNEDEKKDLLHYLGATRVQVMGSSGRMKNTAFGVFSSKEEATQVLQQLHQVEFLGSKLKVEFARSAKPRVASVVDNEGSQNKADSTMDKEDAKDKEEKVVEPCPVKFDSTFQAWGVQYPRRPHLHYLYPPPTPAILTNILNALAAVPKFYVQVLHLMNKMDLPAPFGALTLAPPLVSQVMDFSTPDNRTVGEMDISSETESEIESDLSEGEKEQRSKQKQAVKMLKRQQKRHPRLDPEHSKRLRLSELQESGELVAPNESLPVSEVFDQMSEAANAGRKIALKLPSSIQPVPIPSSISLDPKGDATRIPSVQQMTSHRPNQPSQMTSGQILAAPEPLPTPIQPPPPSSSSSAAAVAAIQSANPLEDAFQNPPPHVQNVPHSSVLPPHSSSQDGAFRHELRPEVPQGWDSNRTPTGAESQNVEVRASVPVPEKPEDLYGPCLPPKSVTASSSDQPIEQVQSGGFGLIQPQKKVADEAGKESEGEGEREWGKSKFISSSELRKRKLSKSEMKDFGVFRNYKEGEPSCRLYIKNLAKQVTEEDIHWIFGRYVNWDDEMASTIFDIRLMKEGRMKGQAFVTLTKEAAAVDAVRDTNGLMLKEKPMVVQFARSAKAQGDEASKP